MLQSVLTGNLRRIARVKLSELGLGDHLDRDVGAFGDHHLLRSELVPTATNLVDSVYGVRLRGHSVVLIGDTPRDIEAAAAHDALSIAVATGRFSATDLAASGADLVLPDLTHLDELLAAITPVAQVPDFGVE